MLTLSDVLDEDLLLKLAGDRSFERGVDYFERGCVQSLAQYDEQITAQVHGNHIYQVNLWLDGDDLQYRCSCPVGIEGWFCKHCVATALAWIAEPPPYRPTPEAVAPAPTTLKDVRDYLARQSQDTLINLILEQAEVDSRWQEQLLMKAAAQQAGGPDIATFRQALRNAIAINDYVDYYGADGYADGVEAVIHGLEDLLAAGYASEVVSLSEDAIALLEEAINNVDDSDGNLNFVIDQVQDLHYRACAIAHPDPQALAERLLQAELKSGFGFFHNAVETYRDVLGEAGLATYQRLVDAEWEQLPDLGSTTAYHFDYRRSQLSRIKESLVKATGNLEDWVAVMAKDLSQPGRYLRIAQEYQQVNQMAAAIAWAEQGLGAFQGNNHRTGQLVEFLITAYGQQGRFDKAVELVWQQFSAYPSLHLYQSLKQQAESAQRWKEWRERAVAYLEQGTTSEHRANPMSFRDASLLVEIFLWEGNPDLAWEKAQEFGCNSRLWMRLADQRSTTHPEDALTVYQLTIEPLVNETNNDAYRQAVDLLIKVKGLMVQLNRQADFERSLTQLKTTYKRKRNFIKLLQQAGLD